MRNISDYFWPQSSQIGILKVGIKQNVHASVQMIKQLNGFHETYLRSTALRQCSIFI